MKKIIFGLAVSFLLLSVLLIAGCESKSPQEKAVEKANVDLGIACEADQECWSKYVEECTTKCMDELGKGYRGAGCFEETCHCYCS